MAENTRIKCFDIAKGIGMLCVIAGHMSITKINSFVFTFHMPLFFLISGYFFKNSISTVKRNIKKLLIPYFVTVIAIMLLDDLKILAKIILGRESISSLLTTAGKWIAAGLYGSGSRTDFLSMEIPYVGAIWFLLAMAWGGIPLWHIKFEDTEIRLVEAAGVYCYFCGRSNIRIMDLAAVFSPGRNDCDTVPLYGLLDQAA